MRLVQGTRIAFQVGIITSLIAIPIGVILGCLAGYFGGRVDDFIVWLYSTFAAIPGLLFILAIAMVVGKGLQGVYLGIGLTTWVGLCRLIRGEVMKHKTRPYVTAARASGLSEFRLLIKYPVRVAINPIVSTIGWELTNIISGAPIVGIVLSLPDTGPLFVDSLLNSDLYLAGALILIYCALVIIGTLISDLLLIALDPRIDRKSVV